VAGEVVEVGQGVQKFKAGDKVVAYLNSSVSVHVVPLVTFYRFMLISSNASIYIC
jgi:NADPH:quinone reductase-like Zn-dependent oxidoreductase